MALAVGVGIGLVNGLLVTRLHIEPFIATLGMFALARGISLYAAPDLSGSVPAPLKDLYGWRIGPVFGLVVLAALVWVVVAWALYRTRWGVHLHATGADPAVATVSGIPVRRIKLGLFVLAGLRAASPPWSA
ncbi:MAG: ABC transporter permease [Frankiaceae bacterium]